MTYKRILVAVDGSEISSRALDEAISLAAQTGATLRIAHVLEEPSISLDFATGYEQFVRGLRGAAQKILEEARARASKGGRTAETALLEVSSFGPRPSEMIVAEAGRWPADLIVIGTHGRRGMNRLLLGSVADGVIRASTVPVLLIRG